MPNLPKSIDEEKFREAFPKAKSWNDLCHLLRISNSKNNVAKLKEMTARFGLENKFIDRQSKPAKHPLDYRWIDTNSVKNLLWSQGKLERKCSVCGVGEWQGSYNHLKLVRDKSTRDTKAAVIKCANCIEAGK